MKALPIPVLAIALLLPAVATPALAAKKASAKPRPVAADTAPAPGALLSGARDAAAKGQTDLAVRLAQSAIVAEPAQPAPYIALGDIYAAAGAREGARAYYNKALGIDPAEPAALKALAALDRAHSTTTAQSIP